METSEVMHLPIADIAVKDRIRKKQTPEGLSRMAQSLVENGQIHAIRVRRPDETDDPEEIKGKPWVLVAGGRRVGGAVLAGLVTLRAEDYGKLTPYQRMKIELEENLQREDMHFADVAETKLRLHELYQAENPDQQIGDTAEAIGESISNVSRDLKLAQAIRSNPSLRKAGSKKAALQAVKMDEFGKAKLLQLESRGYSTENFRNNLETADARDWIRRQETGSIDIFASDLPYGIEYFDRPLGEDNEDLSEYDDSRASTSDLVTDLIPQILRVTNEMGWIVLFTGWEGWVEAKKLVESCCLQHFEYIEAHKKTKECKYLITPPKPWIWYRPNSRNNAFHPDLHAQNQYEPIFIANRGEGKMLSHERAGNVLVHDAVYGGRIHEMQKPIDLWIDIFERLAVRGSMIADCCFGSGSTLAAAAAVSCRFKGCELNPNMLGPAIGLIAEHYKGELTK